MGEKKAPKKIEVRAFFEPAIIRWMDKAIEKGVFTSRADVVRWAVRKVFEGWKEFTEATNEFFSRIEEQAKRRRG